MSRSKLPSAEGTNWQVKKDEDIFETLLGRADSAYDPPCISGEQVSVAIATCPLSEFSLQRAQLIRNKLLICRRSNSTRNQVMSIFVASREIKFKEMVIPSFQESPLKEYVLSPPTQSVWPISTHSPNATLMYRPSLFVVACDNPSNQMQPYCDALLKPDLFSKLFGPEITLSESPVLLVGCENGQIVYASLSQIGIEQVVLGKPLDQSSPLPFLYSLGQSVASIHAVHFPERVVSELESLSAFNLLASSPTPHVPNALVFVGRLGKIVVCTGGLSSQRTPSFLEFHVPGPIASSLLVKGHALFYTTLSEMRKICVSEKCVRAMCESSPNSQSVLIPEVSLRLPERVALVDNGTVLLDSLHVETSGSNKVFELACVTSRGRVYCHKINTKICGEGTTEKVDPTVLVEDLKRCLASIESTSDRLDELSVKIANRDEILAELSQVLLLVCDVAQLPHSQTQSNDQSDSSASTDQSDSSRCPFQCEFEPCYEEVGVHTHRACVDVKLTFDLDQSIPLSSGWALVIQSCPNREDHTSEEHVSTVFGGVPKTVTTKQVPLGKLQPGSFLSTRVYLQLEPGKPLLYKLQCFLHYNTSHLVGVCGAGFKMATPTTVTLPLCEKSFDAIDFLLPLQPTPKRLQFAASLPDSLSMLGLTGSHDSDESVMYTATARMVSLGRRTTGTNPSLPHLRVLLQKKKLIDLIVEDTEESSQIDLTSYTGSTVRFKNTHVSPPSQLTLTIQSTSKSVLAEIVECVQNRLLRVQTSRK